MNLSTWVCTKTAARYLSISPRALADMRQRGRGPAYAKIGRLIRYNIADLDSWIVANYRRTADAVGIYIGPVK